MRAVREEFKSYVVKEERKGFRKGVSVIGNKRIKS